MDGEGRLDAAQDRSEEKAQVERVASVVARLKETRPWGTWSLAAICIAIFAWMEGTGGSTRPLTLFRLGAAGTGLVEVGEWWRLISAAFLHVGMLHIAINMFSLLSVGTTLERYFGNARFLALCVAGQVAGAIGAWRFDSVVPLGSWAFFFASCGAALWIGVRHGKDLLPAAQRWMTRGMLFWVGVNAMLWATYFHCGLAGLAGSLVAGALFAALVPPVVLRHDDRRTRSPLTAVCLSLGLSLFAVEGYVLWRGVASPGSALGPEVTHVGPGSRYEVSLPAVLVSKPSQGSELFDGPGVSVQIAIISLDAPIDLATAKETKLEDLEIRAGVPVTAATLQEVSGKRWLLIDGVARAGGLQRIGILSEGRALFRIWLVSTGGDFEEAKRIHLRAMESFRTHLGK